MRILTVTITKEMAQKHAFYSGKDCPLYHAIKEQLGDIIPQGEVGTAIITDNDGKYYPFDHTIWNHETCQALRRSKSDTSIEVQIIDWYN